MSSDVSLYRTVWRWHFYAGLIILPVLVWLAVTGALYLYKPELEHALYRQWIELPNHVHAQPVSELQAAVQNQTGGRVTQIARPASSSETWRFTISSETGAQKLAYVRPDTGLVLGVVRDGGALDLIKELHSLSVVGPIANIMIEIVAGWAIILVLTGFYLWWPRAGGRALSLAGRVGERRFWKNLHASVGALVGVIILFLAVTGMPWTAFWGERFHSLVASSAIGRPSAPHAGTQGHDEHLPWTLQGRAAPSVAAVGDNGPDAAIAAAARHGLTAPWILDIPNEPGTPYRISAEVIRAQDARLLYIDPSSSHVLQADSWQDFGAGAKAFEWGIYTHQGQQYGEPNRLVMLAGCIGVLLLAATAPVLWWKRRRKGRLEPPPASEGQKKGFLSLMLILGVLYPLTGLTMLAALLVEYFMPRHSRPVSA